MVCLSGLLYNSENFYLTSRAWPVQEVVVLRPNKKIPVFRVTVPYLNLLVKPKKSGFLEKVILCILKGEIPFKMHKIIFSRKKIIKKYMCAYPT